MTEHTFDPTLVVLLTEQMYDWINGRLESDLKDALDELDPEFGESLGADETKALLAQVCELLFDRGTK